jgi:hypothetical protein
MGNSVGVLCLKVFDCNVMVQCEDGEAQALLVANYGQMQARIESANLKYAIQRDIASHGFFIVRGEQRSPTAMKDGELLCLFERDITIQLQKVRRDLYFVHSAVLEFQGNAYMLVGTNRTGKSTTTWALLHHGFSYLSDELAPVDPITLQVYPYPRALWLRREPPGPYQLPNPKLQTSRMLCVPTSAFPNGVTEKRIPLRAIFFVRHDSEAARPFLRLMSKVEAAAGILANTLNPGSHSGNGLDAAVEMSTRIICYELLTAGLLETCNLVKNVLTRPVGEPESRWPCN